MSKQPTKERVSLDEKFYYTRDSHGYTLKEDDGTENGKNARYYSSLPSLLKAYKERGIDYSKISIVDQLIIELRKLDKKIDEALKNYKS